MVQGVYTTIGVQQQQMDIFGIAPKLKARKSQVALAEAALNLSKLELQQKVKEAYANAWIARQNYQLYQRLDSIYQNFQRGARLRYEVEETSKLAYLAASNQVKQMTLQKEQAAFDYQTSLYKLNLWLVSDSVFTVVDSPPENWTNSILPPDSLNSHPRLSMAAQQVVVANAERKAANTDFLPKLNAQYGIQEISGQSGFYQYQVGLTIPLFFMKEQGRAQAARIAQEIAAQNLRQTQFELKAEYLSLLQEYEKWQASWLFYEQEALPLAREQREGAILAYQEGGIDYVSFIQNLKESLQVEVKSREALQEYLQARFQLEYYLNSSNQ